MTFRELLKMHDNPKDKEYFAFVFSQYLKKRTIKKNMQSAIKQTDGLFEELLDFEKTPTHWTIGVERYLDDLEEETISTAAIHIGTLIQLSRYGLYGLCVHNHRQRTGKTGIQYRDQRQVIGNMKIRSCHGQRNHNDRKWKHHGDHKYYRRNVSDFIVHPRKLISCHCSKPYNNNPA